MFECCQVSVVNDIYLRKSYQNKKYRTEGKNQS